ncbi:hypothetical protein LXL04_012707 [Taraxacum kok-saghyz]
MAVEVRTEMDLDVAEEEAVDLWKFERLMNVSNGVPCYILYVLRTLDVTEMKVECPGKVEMN